MIEQICQNCKHYVLFTSYCKLLDKVKISCETCTKYETRRIPRNELIQRFIRLNDTHIKDTFDGEEYYAPCDPLLLYKLNELHSEKEGFKTQIKKEYVHIKRLEKDNIELSNENLLLKQALTRVVEEFDDKISEKSPIRDLIK